MEKKLTYVAKEKDEGRLLDQILRKELGLTAAEISRAKFRENGICVNGERKKVIARICSGDRVEVLLETKEDTSYHLVSHEGELRILYEDKDVIVLDKPAGLVVHPTGAHFSDTLANRLAAHLRKKGEDSVIRILGRLDKDTSGVVLAAKNRAAALRLERQRETGSLQKTYLAVTEGIPEPRNGCVRKLIGPDPTRKGKMQVSSEGACAEALDKTYKKAVTYYDVLKERHDRALVRLDLLTGRTHQIRVHMASIGCPLVGDPLYGKVSEDRGVQNADRMLLHAEKLRFLQPFSREEIIVEAPLPDEFAL